MIGWMFEALWHALLGLVLLVGFLGGAVFVIAREIGKGAEHDFARCQCIPCRDRRNLAYKKRVRQRAREDTPVKIGFVSTEQLRTADRVEAKGARYEVFTLIGHAGGIDVTLVNLGTGKRAIVPVSSDRKHLKLWKMV